MLDGGELHRLEADLNEPPSMLDAALKELLIERVERKELSLLLGCGLPTPA